ncbi:MAG: serine/threonine-protein phosphatase [Saprospiraceae bacterium]|nr:serine/threonine-protein phosphatase [Saprospiraceae bacterium]MBP7680066.1 serine/threonine-protein phosphatase [Saprospiraceae bacterium]
MSESVEGNEKGVNNIIEVLEHEIHLQQLQVNGLLAITQAINSNISSQDLFRMYRNFLSFDMAISKMVLYISRNDRWLAATHVGVPEEALQINISDELAYFKRLRPISEPNHPLLKEFDFVIPVLHKNYPIAYTLIGGLENDDDTYNKIQFITTITNIIAVAIENKRLFKRQLQQERLNKEMELAGQMQQMLIPTQLPQNKYYELASIYQPQMGVGGDYFDFIELEDDKFAFCIADISGKGVAAALLMANFQANLHTLVKKQIPLQEFIQELNNTVIRVTNGDKFITFFIAVFDKKNRRLQYISAGHMPSILIMQGEVFLLDKGCTILGTFDVLPEVEVGEIHIPHEAIIVAYTDGVTDLQNEQGEFFNEDLLMSFAKSQFECSAQVFNTRLQYELENFKGDSDYSDDITLLTCKIYD